VQQSRPNDEERMAELTLKEILYSPETRPALVADCQRLLDSEVSKKRGISGSVIKGAYKTVTKLKPGLIRGVMDLLLGEWMDELEPEYQAYLASGQTGSFGDHLLGRKQEVAERMLAVTDRRAATTSHKTAGKFYKRLRGGAKAQVVESLPAAAVVLDRHLA
jgi:hypothetical protein